MRGCTRRTCAARNSRAPCFRMPSTVRTRNGRADSTGGRSRRRWSTEADEMPGADRAATKEDDMAGDNGGGDIISISGNISGSGIAVGRGAKARVTTGPSAAEINALFAQLVEAVRNAPTAGRDEAVRTAEALKAEVIKGDGIDDSRMARLLDRLV